MERQTINEINHKINLINEFDLLKNKMERLNESYKEYNKKTSLISGELSAILAENPDIYYDVSHENIVFMLKYQNGLNVFNSSFNNEIHDLQELSMTIENCKIPSEDFLKIKDTIFSKNKKIDNIMKLVPKSTWKDKVNLRNLNIEIYSIIEAYDKINIAFSNALDDLRSSLNHIEYSFNVYDENNKIYYGYDYIGALDRNEKYLSELDISLANLEYNLANEQLTQDEIESLDIKIQYQKEEKELIIDENKAIESALQLLGLSRENRIIMHFPDIIEMTSNDISGNLTVAIAGFKVIDTNAIEKAVMDVAPIKGLIPQIPQVN